MQKSSHLLVVISALLVLAGALSAAPPTATFLLNSAGSGANLAGVYTSPYTGQINGGPTIPVICDDFADDSYVPEQWTAYQTALSSVVSGTPDTYLRWLNTAGATVTINGSTLNQAQAYAVAAVLAFDILQSSGVAQEDYSFAMWELFDPTQASLRYRPLPASSDKFHSNRYQRSHRRQSKLLFKWRYRHDLLLRYRSNVQRLAMSFGSPPRVHHCQHG